MASPLPPISRTPARFAALAVVLLSTAALVVLGACSPLHGPAQEPDPGIAADLAVVQSRTETLFQQLDRNASMPFSEYDAMQYRPLLEMVGEAQRLARVHDRSDHEQKALDHLAQTYQDMRTQHREGKLSYESLQHLRASLQQQIDDLMKMEQQ